MSAMSIQTEALVPALHALEAASHVGMYPIRTEAQYEKMLVLMNRLLDLVGDEEEHPLETFLDLIGQLVENYENKRYPIANAAPRET